MLLLFLLFIRVVYIFTYDPDLEGVEFAMLHLIQLITLKGHLYENPEKFPYLLIVHAPMYYFMMAGIMKICSINVIKDVHMMYIIGRTISFLLLFVNFYFLLKITSVLVDNFKYKIYLLLIFILFLPSHFYACRPDSIKTTFFILFLYNFILFIKSNKLSYNFIALFFLFLSILCKQDVLVYGVLIYGIYFLLERKIIYMISLVILIFILSFCVYFHYLYSGINLVKVLFFYNLQYTSDLTINLILISCHLLRASPLFIFTLINFKSKNKLTFSLSVLSTCFIGASTLLMFRTGSNINYTYESVILLLLNVVLFLNEEHPQLNKYLKYSTLNNFVVCMYVFFLFSFNQFLYYKTFFLSKEELKYKNEFISSEQTSIKIKRIIGKNVLFIPDMKYYIFYPDANMIYGSDWHYDRYCEIALNLHIKPEFLQNDIVSKYDEQFTNGEVKYILVENNAKSARHMLRYYPNYNLFQQIDNFILYKYNSVNNPEL